MAHLLLIDDDPTSSLEPLRQAFRALAHGVEIAGTGAERLELACTRRPDVILLEPCLPHQSGLEVYGEIRRMGLRASVVFVAMARTADSAPAPRRASRRRTVLPSRRPCRQASSSATRREPSPVPTAAAWASSSSAQTGRCFSTTSTTGPWHCKPISCSR